jgi:hypothetical protein
MPGQDIIASTKKFSNQSFNTVAPNRISDLATDRQTKPSGPLRPAHDDDNEMGRMALTPHLSDPIEFTSSMKSKGRGKTFFPFSHVAAYLEGIVADRIFLPLARRRLITV